MFQPLHGLVTVLLDPPASTTPGGLILPDNAEQFRTGTVRAVGLGRLCENNQREQMPLVPGDRILIGATKAEPGPGGTTRYTPRYAMIQDGDEEVALLNFTDILGIVEHGRMAKQTWEQPSV